MAWNKPGDDQRNPWDRKPDNADGPPEIEQLLKRFFGGKKKPTGGGMNKQTPPAGSGGHAKAPFIGIVVIILVVAIIWALSGIYIVQQAERGVVLRFGKYTETVKPGPHWYPRFIDKVYVLNVDQISNMKLQESMLTSKENIVDVEFAVQYRIGDIEDYMFNVISPESSLRQIVDSAVRQVIGTSTLDNILTVGRAKIAEKVRAEVSQLAARYKTGLMITDVTMLPAKAPEQVKAAFDDVIKAREDNQRLQNVASSYANSVVPVAQGKAKRILQEADAYQKQVIFQAKGAVAQFKALVSVYKQAPRVTAERMYFDAMQSVLSQSHTMLVEPGAGGSMYYLPLAPHGSTVHLNTQSQPTVPTSSSVTSTTNPTTASSNASGLTPSQAAFLRWKEAQNA